MMWLVTLLILALLGWFAFRWWNARQTTSTAAHDSLGRDPEDAGRSLPGQRAATGGDVEDTGRARVGGPDSDGTGNATADRVPADDGVTPEMASRAASGDGRHGGEVVSAVGDRTSVEHGAVPHDDTLPGGDGHAGGTPDGSGRSALEGEAGAGTPPSERDDELHRVGASVMNEPEPGSPDGHGREGGVGGERSMDAATAARAAHESENTGGTGAAALAGMATAASVGDHGHDEADDHAARTAGTAAANAADAADTSAADADGIDDGAADRGGVDEDSGIANPPVAETAGSLELEGRSTDSAAVLRDGDDTPTGRPDTDGTVSRRPTDDAEDGQSLRDNAATNAPIGSTDRDAAARDVADVPAANVAAAESADTASSPEERANAPIEREAGERSPDGPLFRDRSIDARSNVVAGTVTLATGGATSTGGAAVLEDGRTPQDQAERLRSGTSDGSANGADATRLEGGDARANVREMMKILNLRDGDAGRLGISKDDFARLWQGDAAASDGLVDDVSTRLRRMLAG